MYITYGLSHSNHDAENGGICNQVSISSNTKHLGNKINEDNMHKDEEKSVSLSIRLPQHIQNNQEKDDNFNPDAPCGVCWNAKSCNNDALIFCDGCNVPIHQTCYCIRKSSVSFIFTF